MKDILCVFFKVFLLSTCLHSTPQIKDQCRGFLSTFLCDSLTEQKAHPSLHGEQQANNHSMLASPQCQAQAEEAEEHDWVMKSEMTRDVIWGEFSYAQSW